jgi:hypothetical protein
MTKQDEPVTLFYSYAHEDKALCKQLETHLSSLCREGLISHWHDRRIVAGTAWKQQIDVHLESASIILLLISSDFLASNYCYSVEMQRALERYEAGEARVIPIILRPVDWENAPFAHLQSLPDNGKPVTTWVNRDAAFLNITKKLREVIVEQEDVPHPLAPLSSRDRKNRRRLLRRVRATWIEGVLEHSLHQTPLITLNLQEQPDALTNSWAQAVQETNQPPHFLPPGTSIMQVYDKYEGELLILGKPGAGKTTCLLELTRTLLELAEKDERLPMPVVFHLSSWVQKQDPLATWLIEELQTAYEVSHKTAEKWIEADKVLPLLDGLDEIATKEARCACVEKINDYYREREGSPIVVCCRNQEYTMLSKRPKSSKRQKHSIRVKLKLLGAVSILDLTDEQINSYLEQVGGQVKGLREALDKDAELHSLAHQPLMLNIMTLAYQGMQASEIITGEKPEKMRYTIISKYVDTMLNDRGKELVRWEQEQVRRWLTFLAKQMQAHNQTIFSVESLQPSWLPNRWRMIYDHCMGPVTGLLVGLSTGLVDRWDFGLLGGLFSWWYIEQADKHFDILGPVAEISHLFAEISHLDKETQLFPNQATWFVGTIGLVTGLVGGLLAGLSVWLITRQISGHGIGLVGGLIFLFLIGIDPFVMHFLLRLFLAWQGNLPWHLVPFLEEARERSLLLRTGGSYIFPHRMFLDYFASLDGLMPSEGLSQQDKIEKTFSDR